MPQITQNSKPKIDWVCPDCRKVLTAQSNGEQLNCLACQAVFPVVEGVPKLWPPSRAAALEASVAGFREIRAPVREHPLFRALLPPDPICDPDSFRRESSVKNCMSSGLVLNLGSKTAQWGSHVINLDLVMPLGKNAATANVDVLADIERLPLADASVDGIICTSVLEHVANAPECMQEISRIIKPGGHVYITVPFIFPTHPDPLDRWRWTLDGLRHSMRAFEELGAGACGGPFSAYVSITPTLMGSLFSNFYLFNIVRCTLGWALWPVKFLDHLAWRSDKAYMVSANCYYFGRKR